MIHFIWSILVGFFIGFIARVLLPGPVPMGFLATSIVGILGSVIGGLIGTVLSRPSPDSRFHPAGFFMSVIGAMVLLYGLRFVH